MAASERILPAIILLISMIATSALVMAMMEPTLQQSSYAEGDVYETIGFEENTLYSWYVPHPDEEVASPHAMDPTPITSANVTDEYKTGSGFATTWYEAAVNFSYEDSDHPHMHDIRMYVIRDGDWSSNRVEDGNAIPKDGLIFRMDWGLSFAEDTAIDAVSYDEIENNQEMRTKTGVNYSKVEVSLNTVYAVFISMGPGNFEELLWANQYNVSIGYSLEQAVEDVSPWSLIVQILTFQLPDTDPTIRILIAVPFYITMAVCGLVIVTWFKPLS